jgi:hypothetical protein
MAGDAAFFIPRMRLPGSFPECGCLDHSPNAAGAPPGATQGSLHREVFRAEAESRRRGTRATQASPPHSSSAPAPTGYGGPQPAQNKPPCVRPKGPHPTHRPPPPLRESTGFLTILVESQQKHNRIATFFSVALVYHSCNRFQFILLCRGASDEQ